MRYQRVHWRQASPDYPVVLYAEIDEDNWERRKVDEFADGRLAWATGEGGNDTTNTFLGLEPIPNLESINAQSKFAGEPISAADFEAVWARATGSPSRDIGQR
jgi:hypothetical protein